MLLDDFVRSVHRPFDLPRVDSEGVTGGPAVANGTVYVNGSALSALDAASGDRQWVFEDLGGPSGVPDIRDGDVYVGRYAEGQYAIDAADGTERWSSDLGSLGQVVTDEAVYLARGSNGLAALNRSTGDELWTHEGHDYTVTAPVVASGLLFTGDESGLTAYQEV